MKGRRMYDDGGEVANTILQQLGGAGRLRVMTGAYNFYDLGDGLSFKIKNPKANYIKIKLTPMDLYDVEVGRVRGTTYKVVQKAEGLYFDQLRPFIEKATGMYLSLRKGGQIEKAIKQKLSKSFDLPLQMAVYVPSTKDKNVVVSKQEMDERVLEVKSYLAELFGGFNSVKVEGGFESSDKGLIEEDAVRIVAFASQDGFESKFEKLISKIKIWCKEWSQESIGLEFENDLFYIESGSQYSKGGMIEHKTEDGETLKYKIDKDEMSLEVDFPTMEYLSENGIVMKREARKLKDTYIFWYDEINNSSREELEEVLKVELPISGDEDDYEDDDYEDYAKGGEVYKLGDKWSDVFDYKGMLKMGLKAQTSWGSKKLRKLYDSYEDVNYHKASTNLWNAIESIKKSEEVQSQEAKDAYILAADNYIERFHDDVIEEMLSQMEDVKEEPEDRNLGYEDGGQVDLFEQMELLPEEVQSVLGKYSDGESYLNLENLLEELKPLGYTFEYGLDAVPFGLTKMADGGMTDKTSTDKLNNLIREESIRQNVVSTYVVYLSSDDKGLKIGEYENLIPYSAQADRHGDFQVIFKKDRTLYIFTNSVTEIKEDRESFEKYSGLINLYIPLTDKLSSEIIKKVFDSKKMSDGGEVFKKGYYVINFIQKNDADEDVLSKTKSFYASSQEELDETLFNFYDNFHAYEGYEPIVISIVKTMDYGGMMSDGGDIADYKRWESRYDMLSEQFEDADSEERKRIQKEMDELESKMHKSERRYGKGGKVKKRVRFVDKVESIADRLEGTKVPKRLKKDYGGKYNREEAEEAGRRIAGAQLRDRKMADGGQLVYNMSIQQYHKMNGNK